MAVCGAGAAGIEMSFAFKARWGKLFNEPNLRITLISADEVLLKNDSEAVRNSTIRKLKEHNIDLVYSGKV